MPKTEFPGALVISLDFELLWGVRDRVSATSPYADNLHGGRAAIPRLLELFAEFNVAATWAVVGFLFANSRAERMAYTPPIRPSYERHELNPYGERTGETEEEDPLHYAPSLIELIRCTSRQEIATHTFSHYYALESGQDAAAFGADLDAAIAIARSRGIALKSIVFPRNQHNPQYDRVLLERGVTAYRGNPVSWIWKPERTFVTGLGSRGARLLDTYVGLSGSGTVAWRDVAQPNGLSNVRASYFIRPSATGREMLDPLRARRIGKSLYKAAHDREILHLWWHPHNFGKNLSENLRFLRNILEQFRRYQRMHSMLSLTMAEVASMVRER